MPASDIIVSAARIFRAPVGTALPAKTVAYGDAWGGAWVEFGYTAAPLTVNRGIETIKKMVQQELSSVGEVKTGESFTLETVLAEFTMANLGAVTGDETDSEAAASGVPGYDTIQGGGQTTLPVYAWGVEFLKYEDDTADERAYRLLIPKGRAILNGNLEFGKEVQTGIPFRVEAQADLTLPRGQRLYSGYGITADALA
jgi:hypothetical protein